MAKYYITLRLEERDDAHPIAPVLLQSSMVYRSHDLGDAMTMFEAAIDLLDDHNICLSKDSVSKEFGNINNYVKKGEEG